MKDVIDESTLRMVTEDRLEELRELQRQFDHLTKLYGELHYQKKLIEAQILETDGAMDDLEVRRLDTIQSITDQFGSGEIDLVTGAFIPDQK